MRKLAQFTFLVITLLCCLTGLAVAEKRVALVIGNSRYLNVPELVNPKNDAADISRKLNALGFRTLGGEDLTREAMQSQIREFSRATVGADVALFFYAGHGVQVEGINYALPIDSKLEALVDLSFEALSLDVVLSSMEQNAKTSILFLDACRDNPLAKNLARSMGTRSSAVGRGLAKIGSGVGSLIAFATQPGNVALDDSGRNSPFTTALLKHLGTDAEGISSELILVRRDVIAATDGQQVPWDSSSLTGKVVLGLPSTIADKATKDREAEVAEASAWANIKSTTHAAALEAFLRQFPEGSFANIAKLRMESLKLALMQTPQAAVEESPAQKTEEPDKPARSLAELFADGLARKVKQGELPVDSHDKLRLAVAKLSDYEIRVGEFRNSFYVAVLTNGMNWEASKSIAEASGGHMATIKDQAENDFIFNLFKNDERFVEINKEEMDIYGPFIGLTQAAGSKEPRNGWSWYNGEATNFRNWNPGQPNDSSGNADVTLFYDFGSSFEKTKLKGMKWDDFPRFDNSPGFILEIDR